MERRTGGVLRLLPSKSKFLSLTGGDEKRRVVEGARGEKERPPDPQVWQAALSLWRNHSETAEIDWRCVGYHNNHHLHSQLMKIIFTLFLILIAMDESRNTYSQGKDQGLVVSCLRFSNFPRDSRVFYRFSLFILFHLMTITVLTWHSTVKEAAFRCLPSWWNCTSSTSRRSPAGTRRRQTTWRSWTWCWGWVEVGGGW